MQTEIRLFKWLLEFSPLYYLNQTTRCQSCNIIHRSSRIKASLFRNCEGWTRPLILDWLHKVWWTFYREMQSQLNLSHSALINLMCFFIHFFIAVWIYKDVHSSVHQQNPVVRKCLWKMYVAIRSDHQPNFKWKALHFYLVKEDWAQFDSSQFGCTN